MKNAINYIIDNPYGEIFTLTSPNTGETKTIDREEAEGHLKYLPSVTFFSAKAEVNLKSVSCGKEKRNQLHHRQSLRRNLHAYKPKHRRDKNNRSRRSRGSSQVSS